MARRVLLVLLVCFFAFVPACSCSDDETHEHPAEDAGDRCAPPALAPGTVARFVDAVRFLYDGPCPRQTGVDKAVFVDNG